MLLRFVLPLMLARPSFTFPSVQSPAVTALGAGYEGEENDESLRGDLDSEYEHRRTYHIRGLVDDLEEGEEAIVETAQGALRGRRIEGDPNAGGVVSTVDWFLGVPYAQPPVGDLRFAPTQPPGSWNGTLRNATRYGAACPQLEIHFHYASVNLLSEDCLYLNVYAPHHATVAAPLSPVMVYIHGGSYRAGSGSVYVGHVLAQYGVVIVTLNYRLDVLGFLSAMHPSLPGNYGLLDQIEALKWIKRNIRAFGGDPDKVTIFGNSAGGSSVGLLSTSPLAAGLYSQLIMQSGSPLAFWAVHDTATDLVAYVRNLSSRCDCDRASIPELVSCLRLVPWPELIMHAEQLTRITASGDDLRPVWDDHVLLTAPSTSGSSGHPLRPPGGGDEGKGAPPHPKALMIGVVTEEWSRHLGFFLTDLFDENDHLDSYLPDGFEHQTFEAAIEHVMCRRFGYHPAVATVVKHAYTSWDLVEDPLEHRRQYINFVTDMAMTAPMFRVARLYAARAVPVYVYVFDHHKEQPHDEFHAWQANYHEMELNYVFGSPFTLINTDAGAPDEFSDGERELSRRVMTLWSNFAKHGNPSGDPADPDSVPWALFHPSTNDYILLTANSSAMGQHFRWEKISLWNELIPDLSERLRELESRPYRGVSSSPNVELPLAPPLSSLEGRNRPGGGGGGGLGVAGDSLWILAAVCVAQTVLLVIVVVVLVRQRQKYNKLSRSPQIVARL